MVEHYQWQSTRFLWLLRTQRGVSENDDDYVEDGSANTFKFSAARRKE